MFSENGKVGLLDENGKILLKANLLFLDADNAGNVLVREKDSEETKTLALDTFLKTYVK